MSSQEITLRLFYHFNAYLYHLANAYIYAWESDFFCMSKSGYTYEFEIKISRSDFKADFKKVEKHTLLGMKENFKVIPGHYWEGRRYSPAHTDVRILDRRKLTPNRFYYVTPKGLLTVSDIPEYAGLLEIEGKKVRITKTAPLLHKEKQDLTQTLLQKFYWAYRNLKF